MLPVQRRLRVAWEINLCSLGGQALLGIRRQDAIDRVITDAGPGAAVR